MVFYYSYQITTAFATTSVEALRICSGFSYPKLACTTVRSLTEFQHSEHLRAGPLMLKATYAQLWYFTTVSIIRHGSIVGLKTRVCYVRGTNILRYGSGKALVGNGSGCF